MKLFTEQELNERHVILQSHKNFDKFLNKHIINTLINLFDDTPDKFLNINEKMIKYIDTERKERKLSNININLTSYVFGENKNNSTLIFIISKNNKDYIHLSIHLSLQYLKPEDTGMIHIYKDIYEPNVSNRKQRLLYALISVEKPKNKPKSLEFSIADGYNTNPIIKDVELYDKDIQKEMNVIISVLNKLFDETNKEYYVGSDRNISFIHNKTNKVLTNMNQHTQHIIRQNVGSKIIPLSNNKTIHTIHRRKNNQNRKTRRRKSTTHKNSYNMLENAEL